MLRKSFANYFTQNLLLEIHDLREKGVRIQSKLLTKANKRLNTKDNFFKLNSE